MKNFKLFKRSALLLAVVVLAVVLTVGAIAGAALLSDEGSADYGEQYAGVKVGTSGKVSLKFYYSTTGTAEEFVAKVIDPETGTTETQYFAVADLEETGDGFCVPVALAPSQMTHTVKIYASGTSGNGAPIVYSVKEYAEDVLADASKAEYHDAMRALLNWGGMAQTRFQDATSSPAYANLFERGTNSIYHVNTITYTKGEVVNGTTITGNEMNLSLEPNNLAIHFYVNYTGNGTLTATVSKNGGTPVSTNVTETDKGWLVRVANVPASLFDTPYTVTVTDGTDTFTATKTVREYLGVQLAQCNAIVNDKEAAAEVRSEATATGNVVRAMYQLYQFTTGNTGAETCNHGNAANRVYWISAGGNKQIVRCVLCHADLGHQEIDAGVNAYAPAKNFLLSSVTGHVDRTLMEEDGVQFVRLNNYYAGRDNWGDITLSGLFTGNTGVSGQYLVVKFRASGLSAGTVEVFANTNKGTATGLTGKGQANFLNNNDGEWHTVIINLAERVSDPSAAFVDEGDGTYNVRYLSMRLFGYPSVTVTDDSAEGRYAYSYEDANGAKYSYYGTKLTEEEMAEKGYTLYRINKLSISADAHVDIAYAALCDSEADAKTLIDTDTYEISASNTFSNSYNTADDSHAHIFRDKAEYVDGDTYGYAACIECGEYKFSKTIPESVKLYFSPKSLATRQASNSVEQKTTYDTLYNSGLGNNPPEFHVDSNVAYARIYGKDAVAQWIWNRGPGVNGYADGNSQDYTVNVGKATHLVIKMRSTMPTETLQLCFSTAGVSGAGYSNLPTNMTAGEWTTVIIDLERVFGSQYAAEENGDHLIDTFYFHIGTFSAANKADFAYIAFVEGGLDEVANIVDTDTALIQIAAHGEGYAVDPETCTCVEHACVTTVVDGVYTSACSVCGTVVADYGVKAEGPDLFWSAENIKSWANITGTADKTLFYDENGTAFVRFDNTKVNADNWSAFQVNNGSTVSGQYMVMKYRIGANGLGQTSLSMYITSAPAEGWWSGSATAKVSEDNQWHYMVIDLANRVTAGGFNANGDGTYTVKAVQIRYFTNHQAQTQADDYMDVSYMAFCDSMDDIKNIIDAETYELSVDSSTNAVRKTADNSCMTCALTEVVDGTTHTIKCSVCGKVSRTYEVPASINWYAPLANMNKYQHSLEKMLYDEEEGVMFNRYTGTGGNHINITGGTGAGSATSGTFTTGKYIVIKYRASNTTLGFNVATGDKKSGNGASLGTQAIANLPGDEWRVAIIDASASAQWTSDGSAQSIYMMITTGSGTYTVDIAYVAVVDSIDEMKLLLQDGETYFDMGTNWAGTPIEYNQDGTKAPCKTCVLPAAATVTDGENGAKIYTYNCTVCGNAISTKTVPAGVIYMAPEVIKTATNTTTVKPEGIEDANDPSVYATKNDLNPQTQFQMTSTSFVYDPATGTPYFGFKGTPETNKTAQLIWNRAYLDYNPNAPGYGRYLLDMGQSKYLVIKARTNIADTNAISLQISTDSDAKNPITIKLPIADIQGDWVTYVIDLETVVPDAWAKDTETGNYIMDSFYFSFNAFLTTDSIDFAYIAFVEGDWSNVDALVDEETVVNVTSASQGYEIVKADGSAAN